MAGNIVSLLYTVTFITCGCFLSRLIFRCEKPLIRIWFGFVFGMVLLMWLPALFSFVLRFSLAAQLCALGIVVLIILAALIIKRRYPVTEAGWSSHKTMLWLLPLALLGIYILYTHTLYPAADGSIHVGQSTYGDLCLHAGFASSLAAQGTFPPEYSILPGTAVGYPFLCDSIAATLIILGASLRFALLFTAIIAYVLVLTGVYIFFEGWLVNPKTALLAAFLFFVGSGFGFAYFFDLSKVEPGKISSIFTSFYNTPTNNPDIGLRWVNTIADMLIPQRATLFGWSILFPCLFLLVRGAFTGKRSDFIVLGVLAGALPMIHTHSFLALGIISAAYLFRAFYINSSKYELVNWLLYAAIASMLFSPQLFGFTFKQANGFLHMNFNWANTKDSYIWFYIKNMGLIFLLLPAAFINADKRDRAIYSGAVLIWILAEFVQFQPNEYDNNKLLFIWFAYTSGLVAKFLIELKAKLKSVKGWRYMSGIAVTALFLSGTLTLGRELVSDYQLIGANGVAAAEFIKSNTPADSVFLTADNHNNPVAALTGRNLVCGTSIYLYFHGIDTSAIQADVARMFTEPELSFTELSVKYNVDYIYVSAYERGKYFIDLEYFENNCAKVYNENGILIYSVK